MRAISDLNRKWWILAAMSGILGLVVLDETVVGVALATIRPDLAMSAAGSHWVVNAYFLTFTCFVAVGGRLGDSLGHHGFLILGMAIFGLASLAAGFAQDGAWLIMARALQGVGAAIIFPASWAVMTSTFPLQERGFAFGTLITVGGVFMSMGPMVGGFLSERISWRWIFWINAPVVACIAAVVFAALAPSRQAKRETSSDSVDSLGLITLVAGLSALVIALMQGPTWGWGASATLFLLGAGILLLIVFAIAETRRSGPLIEIGLLRIATFTGGNLVFFMFQFSKLAVFVFVALYLQEVLHDSPIAAGSILLVAVLPTLVTSLIAGASADRFGSRAPLLLGLLLQGSALLIVGVGMYRGSHALIVAPLIVWGAAMPFVAVGARRALMSAVPTTQQGEASGINLTIQMLGGTIGVALCGTVLATTGHYGNLFLMTGALMLLALMLAFLTVDRQRDAG